MNIPTPSKGQPSVDEILNRIESDYQTTPWPTIRKESKSSLLALALICLPKKVEVPEGSNGWDFNRGNYTTEDRRIEIIQSIAHNTTIDLTETNLRKRFGGSDE